LSGSYEDPNLPEKQEEEEYYDENKEQDGQFDDPYPILFLDVNLGKGRVERLVIYDGDAPMQVAEDFCNKYSKRLTN
jgi:hypothetical protein